MANFDEYKEYHPGYHNFTKIRELMSELEQAQQNVAYWREKCTAAEICLDHFKQECDSLRQILVEGESK